MTCWGLWIWWQGNPGSLDLVANWAIRIMVSSGGLWIWWPAGVSGSGDLLGSLDLVARQPWVTGSGGQLGHPHHGIQRGSLDLVASWGLWIWWPAGYLDLMATQPWVTRSCSRGFRSGSQLGSLDLVASRSFRSGSKMGSLDLMSSRSFRSGSQLGSLVASFWIWRPTWVTGSGSQQGF